MEEKVETHCRNIYFTVNKLAKELGISFSEAISIFMMRELTITNIQLINIQEKLENQNITKTQPKKKNKKEET